jgi:hypothetical protein
MSLGPLKFSLKPSTALMLAELSPDVSAAMRFLKYAVASTAITHFKFAWQLLTTCYRAIRLGGQEHFCLEPNLLAC